MLTLIHGSGFLAERTRRQTRFLGLESPRLCSDLQTEILNAPRGQALLILRAGALLRQAWRPWQEISDKALLLCGACCDEHGALQPEWEDCFRFCGGDLARLEDGVEAPAAPVFWLSPAAVKEWQENGGHPGWLQRPPSKWRWLHSSRLDASLSTQPRIIQVITSLQQGGAERIALELHQELASLGWSSRLMVIGRPGRLEFPRPPGLIDLGSLGRGPALGRGLETALNRGADLIHAHLLDAAELRQIAASGIPVVNTLHNRRRAWPEGLDQLETGVLRLVIACSRQVGADLDKCASPLPWRCIWNGVRPEPLRLNATLANHAAALRADLGLHQRDVLLLALANPRPQKRLERLPEIARRLEALLGPGVEVHLAIAGEPHDRLPEAQACAEALKAEALRCGMAGRLHLPGSLTPEQVPEWLHAADALVSCSDHEGLSLAQLEALFAGRPVVASACGGEEDLPSSLALRLLPLPGGAEEEETFLNSFAQHLRGVVLSRPSCSPSLLSSFTSATMGRRHDLILRQILAQEKGSSDDLVIVTNNFSTGGAQSSLRRLIRQLAARGRRIRLFTLQENPEFPTPGTLRLRSAGFDIESLDLRDHELPEALAPLLEAIQATPPRALVFWNALPAVKCLLADSLLSCPIWDVSPGEMLFASLRRELEQPRPGHSLRNPQDYGRRLSGFVCKYRDEVAEVRQELGIEALCIANGVPLPAHSPEYRDAPALLRLGSAARLHPQKRLEDLLAALAMVKDRLPPFELRIAGGTEDTEYEVRLRRQAQESGLPVTWLGEVHDLAAFHAELDVFVSISEPAGCPNALLEAMAAGLPVAATARAGAMDMIRDGVDALLSPPSDAEALAGSLLRLSQDAKLRRSLGVNARERIRELFSVERMADDYEKLWFG